MDLFRGSYRSKGYVVSYMCSKPVTSLLFFRRALLIARLSDELIRSKLEQTFGHLNALLCRRILHWEFVTL